MRRFVPASRRLTAGLALLAFLAGSVAPLPMMPSRAQAFTVGEEREVGDKLLSLIRKEFTILDEMDLTDYVTALGQQTLRLTGPQFFGYHFFVIDNKEFNAFAAPSGLIFFHSGLVDLCATEGELVSVLAHEIGHAASRHIADRMSKSGKISAGTTALMLAGLLLGQGALSQAVVTGSMAGNLMANLKFSREDEEEADRLAYKWMKEQERDPAEMVSMLKKMRRASRYSRNKVPTYLLTHPEPENRIGYIEDKILQDQPRPFPGRDEFAFQRFKYRVQALTKDPQTHLPLLLNKAEEPGAQDKDPMLFFGIAEAFLINRDFDKAREYLQKVITRFPDKTILRTDQGRYLLEAGRSKEALAIFKEVNQKDPASLYNTYLLGKSLELSGENAKAALILEGLTERVPSNARLYYDIGKLRAALGSPGAGHYNLGMYHYYLGAGKTALYHFKEALKVLPEQDPLTAKVKEMQERMIRLERL
ncbi:MAG: M48 family metalloprotease [Thermodesulfobacteriota bacterium]